MTSPPPNPANSNSPISSKRALPSFLAAKAPSTTSSDDSTASSTPSSVSAAPGSPVDSEKNRKIKGLINRLRSNSSSSTVVASDGKAVSSPPAKASPPPTIVAGSKGGFYLGPSNLVPNADPGDYDSPEQLLSDTPYRQAVVRATKAVDRLEKVQLALGGVIGLAELGAGWVPGVGKAAEVVMQMLGRAQEIALGRVAALRLVERTANVLVAVQQSVIDNKGRLSLVMQQNVERLLANLHSSAYLLTKLAQRSFLKLYLHADETQRQIDNATDELSDIVMIFQIQSHISSAAWQEESRADHQKDLELLLCKQEEARRDDQDLLKLLGLQAEQQQEAIKTLQRTLDNLLAQRTMVAILDQQVRPESPTTTRSHITATSASLSASPGDVAMHVGLAHYSNVPQPRPPRRSFTTDDDFDAHRAFCEHALDVLRRHSAASELGVPDWTITSLEIEHGPRISSGFFSVVYKGRWYGQEVAIKEVNTVANRTLFIHEVDIWRKLRSPFILPFLGASSTTGPPPWFIISPYMRNGDVLAYLRSEAGEHANRFALVHQAAQGMEYLHSREILHGDLKAGNLLVTDVGTAVLCDFGLSHLKLDIVTHSQTDPRMQGALGGTMRWQSPERLAGGILTAACDVYAFGMLLLEVFTGQVPFGYVDDYALRESIKRGERPARPRGIGQDLWTLMEECWQQDPAKRPKFASINKRLARMYNSKAQARKLTAGTSSTSTSSYTTADEGFIPEEQQAISPEIVSKPLPEDDEESSSSGSIRSIPPHLEKELSFESDRAERHFRHYLQHDFDDRLTIPLWFPSVVPLGSVGYIRHGQFVKLVDAHRPPLNLGGLPPMPYLDEFSSLQTTKTPVNVRSAAEKGLDFVTSLTTSFIKSSGERVKQAVSRRIAVTLKPGMKQAVLIIDDGEFEIFQSFAESRAYLRANIDWILEQYGDSHHIAREDVIVVVGTLKATNYTMLVSNFTPRTTLSFNVHANPEPGKAWGTWTVDKQAVAEPSRSIYRPLSMTNTSSAIHGRAAGGGGARPPESRVEDQVLKYTARVSQVTSGPREAVMLAKLRFPSGGGEPGLYP